MNTDAAYIAGVIDSDGYIGVSKTKSTNGNICYYSRLSIAMKQPEAVEFVSKIYNKKFNLRKVHTTLANKKYTWMNTVFEANSIKVKEILIDTFPYLKVKKQQAKLILELIEHINQFRQKPKSVNGQFVGTAPIPIKSRIRREQIYKEVKKLNSNH